MNIATWFLLIYDSYLFITTTLFVTYINLNSISNILLKVTILKSPEGVIPRALKVIITYESYQLLYAVVKTYINPASIIYKFIWLLMRINLFQTNLFSFYSKVITMWEKLLDNLVLFREIRIVSIIVIMNKEKLSAYSAGTFLDAEYHRQTFSRISGIRSFTDFSEDYKILPKARTELPLEWESFITWLCRQMIFMLINETRHDYSEGGLWEWSILKPL